EEPAAIAATAMVYADLSGIDSHGISMRISYEKLRDSGHLNVRAQPVVERENTAMALLNADGGLGHPAAVTAMNLAVNKARSAGVGIVSVHNSRHFGTAGYYAKLAAEIGRASCRERVQITEVIRAVATTTRSNN